jgi:hypothetical protein
MSEVIKISNPEILDILRNKCVDIINRIKLAREKELSDYQPPKWYTWWALDKEGHKNNYVCVAQCRYGKQLKACEDLLLKMRFKTTIYINKEDAEFFQLDTILNNF